MVGSLRDDGKHEVVTLLQRVDIHDDVALEAAGRTHGRGVRGGHDRPERPGVARRRRRGQLRWHARIEKRIPVAAGLGGGSRRCSGSASARERRRCPTPLDPMMPSMPSPLAVGADVPSSSAREAQVATGDGTELTACRPPIDYHVVLVVPQSEKKTVHRCGLRGVRRPPRRNRVRASAQIASIGALESISDSADLARLPANDLAAVADHARARRRGGRFALTSRVPAPSSTASSSGTKPLRAPPRS